MKDGKIVRPKILCMNNEEKNRGNDQRCFHYTKLMDLIFLETDKSSRISFIHDDLPDCLSKGIIFNPDSEIQMIAFHLQGLE